AVRDLIRPRRAAPARAGEHHSEHALMSYILEALKRAERERAQAQNPAASDAAPTTTPLKSGRNTLLKLLIAALVVNALIIVALVMRHKPAPPAAVAQTKSPAVARTATPTPPRKPVTAPVTAPAPPPPDSSSEVAAEQPAVEQGVSSMDDLGASSSDEDRDD